MWGRLSTGFKVGKWVTPSYSRPKPATDNGVRVDGYNCLAVIAYHPLQDSTSERHAQCKCTPQISVHQPGIKACTFCTRCNRTAYATTQGIQ